MIILFSVLKYINKKRRRDFILSFFKNHYESIDLIKNLDNTFNNIGFNKI